ncbi:transposase [Candidatus Omnitrophota bacterium]
MGRLPRVYIENILYYVTSRSVHGQKLFEDLLDYQEYIALIHKYKQQYGVKIFAYCLLPTHLHILIELTNNVPISNIMHDINSLYTKTYNGRYNKKGHLFQERFKTALAEKETHLLPLIRHIHLNPLRSHPETISTAQVHPYHQGLNFQAKIANLTDYAFSSYHQFVNPQKRQYPDLRQEIEEVFALLKGREEDFRKYIAGTDQKKMEEFGHRLHKRRILGSKEFIQHIREVIEEESSKQRRQRPALKKVRIVYAVGAGIVVLLAALTIDYFYRRNLKIKSQYYDKNLILYQRTLEVLVNERDKAVKAQQDAATYQWKIELTERALQDLKDERIRARQELKKIEGYRWPVLVKQISGPQGAVAERDIISFRDNRFVSENFRKAGFSASAYSQTERKDKGLSWETIQTNAQGDTLSWHGEWNGQKMNGVFSWRSSEGVVRDFTFASISERVKI